LISRLTDLVSLLTVLLPTILRGVTDPERNGTLGGLIQDLARLMAQRVDERARRLGLTRAQWALIAALFRREGSSQVALAEHLEVTPISLGRLVDRMEKAGWVERRGEPADRRAYRLYLTERAHRLRPQLRALSDHVQAHALRALDGSEQERFIAQLRTVRETLAGDQIRRPPQRARRGARWDGTATPRRAHSRRP
jgi:MarR family transcriptional regulator, transcriptional regulator for hemolysin